MDESSLKLPHEEEYMKILKPAEWKIDAILPNNITQGMESKIYIIEHSGKKYIMKEFSPITRHTNVYDQITLSHEYYVSQNVNSHFIRKPIGSLIDKDGKRKLILEYCDQTLTDYINNPFKTDADFFSFLTIFTSLLQGLNDLHSYKLPIIHKDIKSANILIKFENFYDEKTKTQTFKFPIALFTDFGCSKNGVTETCIWVGYKDPLPPGIKNRHENTDIFFLFNIMKEMLKDHPKFERFSELIDNYREITVKNAFYYEETSILKTVTSELIQLLSSENLKNYIPDDEQEKYSEIHRKYHAFLKQYDIIFEYDEDFKQIAPKLFGKNWEMFLYRFRHGPNYNYDPRKFNQYKDKLIKIYNENQDNEIKMMNKLSDFHHFINFLDLGTLFDEFKNRFANNDDNNDDSSYTVYSKLFMIYLSQDFTNSRSLANFTNALYTMIYGIDFDFYNNMMMLLGKDCVAKYMYMIDGLKALDSNKDSLLAGSSDESDFNDQIRLIHSRQITVYSLCKLFQKCCPDGKTNFESSNNQISEFQTIDCMSFEGMQAKWGIDKKKSKEEYENDYKDYHFSKKKLKPEQTQYLNEHYYALVIQILIWLKYNAKNPEIQFSKLLLPTSASELYLLSLQQLLQYESLFKKISMDTETLYKSAPKCLSCIDGDTYLHFLKQLNIDGEYKEILSQSKNSSIQFYNSMKSYHTSLKKQIYDIEMEAINKCKSENCKDIQWNDTIKEYTINTITKRLIDTINYVHVFISKLFPKFDENKYEKPSPLNQYSKDILNSFVKGFIKQVFTTNDVICQDYKPGPRLLYCFKIVITRYKSNRKLSNAIDDGIKMLKGENTSKVDEDKIFEDKIFENGFKSFVNDLVAKMKLVPLTKSHIMYDPFITTIKSKLSPIYNNNEDSFEQNIYDFIQNNLSSHQLVFSYLSLNFVKIGDDINNLFREPTSHETSNDGLINNEKLYLQSFHIKQLLDKLNQNFKFIKKSDDTEFDEQQRKLYDIADIPFLLKPYENSEEYNLYNLTGLKPISDYYYTKQNNTLSLSPTTCSNIAVSLAFILGLISNLPSKIKINLDNNIFVDEDGKVFLIIEQYTGADESYNLLKQYGNVLCQLRDDSINNSMNSMELFNKNQLLYQMIKTLTSDDPTISLSYQHFESEKKNSYTFTNIFYSLMAMAVNISKPIDFTYYGTNIEEYLNFISKNIPNQCFIQENFVDNLFMLFGLNGYFKLTYLFYSSKEGYTPNNFIDSIDSIDSIRKLCSNNPLMQSKNLISKLNDLTTEYFENYKEGYLFPSEVVDSDSTYILGFYWEEIINEIKNSLPSQNAEEVDFFKDINKGIDIFFASFIRSVPFASPLFLFILRRGLCYSEFKDKAVKYISAYKSINIYHDLEIYEPESDDDNFTSSNSYFYFCKDNPNLLCKLSKYIMYDSLNRNLRLLWLLNLLKQEYNENANVVQEYGMYQFSLVMKKYHHSIGSDDMPKKMPSKIDYIQLSKTIYQGFKSITLIHSFEFVHCDIKPSNFFVDADNNVYLADLNLILDMLRFPNEKPIPCTPRYFKNHTGYIRDLYAYAVSIIDMLSGFRLNDNNLSELFDEIKEKYDISFIKILENILDIDHSPYLANKDDKDLIKIVMSHILDKPIYILPIYILPKDSDNAKKIRELIERETNRKIRELIEKDGIFNQVAKITNKNDFIESLKRISNGVNPSISSDSLKEFYSNNKNTLQEDDDFNLILKNLDEMLEQNALNNTYETAYQRIRIFDLYLLDEDKSQKMIKKAILYFDSQQRSIDDIKYMANLLYDNQYYLYASYFYYQILVDSNNKKNIIDDYKYYVQAFHCFLKANENNLISNIQNYLLYLRRYLVRNVSQNTYQDLINIINQLSPQLRENVAHMLLLEIPATYNDNLALVLLRNGIEKNLEQK